MNVNARDAAPVDAAPGEAEHMDGDAMVRMLSRYEQERADLMRQIDLLQLEVERHRKDAEAAIGRAAMLELRLNRHFAKCERDVAAVQRLRAELYEANSRRKEQSAVIERREARIAELLAAESPSSGLESKLQETAFQKGLGWLRLRPIRARAGNGHVHATAKESEQ